MRAPRLHGPRRARPRRSSSAPIAVDAAPPRHPGPRRARTEARRRSRRGLRRRRRRRGHPAPSAWRSAPDWSSSAPVGKDRDRGAPSARRELGVVEVAESPLGACTGRGPQRRRAGSAGRPPRAGGPPARPDHALDGVRQSLVRPDHAEREHRRAVVAPRRLAAKDGVGDHPQLRLRDAERDERAARPRSLWTTIRSNRPNSAATSGGARRAPGQQVVGGEDERGTRVQEQPAVDLRRPDPLQMKRRPIDASPSRAIAIGCSSALTASRTGRESIPRGEPVEAVVDAVAGGVRHAAVAEARREELARRRRAAASDAASAWSYGGV